MNFWEHLFIELKKHKTLCLLYVLHSEGSSPGRQGFRQFVSHKGEMHGSIGGGVMEQKLVDFAVSLLNSGQKDAMSRRQIHQTNIERNKSGMICSGEQTVAFYFLNETHLSELQKITQAFETHEPAVLKLNELNLFVQNGVSPKMKFTYERISDSQWCYAESLVEKDKIYIVGGGHVSLALSQCMKLLDFEVIVFDDRNALNTMEANEFADEKEIISYEIAAQKMPEGRNSFVVLMTTGYRTDLIALRNLLGRDYRYIGMLGSKEKVRKLFNDLRSEGFSEENIARVHAPIGLSIHSKTPMEIAISIAAEIICVRNNVS